MKRLAGTILFLFAVNAVFCQSQPTGLNFTFSSDKDLLSPKFLAEHITHTSLTENEKVRSIFTWITDNISYRVRERNRARNYENIDIADDFGDSLYLSKSTDEIIAEKVLKKRSAYCDGYARLFKTLCNYAGLQSEVISGYAKTNASVKVTGFNPNHKWNAVRIDSVWYLLDVTWASGYLSMDGEFVRHYDPYYFMAPPQTFIKDHIPEDLKWTLLQDPPVAKEFKQSPFIYDAFNQFSIVDYKPATGLINAKVGDRVTFEIQTYNRSKNLQILPDHEMVVRGPETDSSVSRFSTGALQHIIQHYTVSAGSNWLYIIYNDEAVMRYKINIRG